MFIRKTYRKKDGKTHAYWSLVESYRTPRGPRQRTVAYLGEMDAKGRVGIEKALNGSHDHQENLFESHKPEWIEVNLHGVRVECNRRFGDIWLALQLLKRLGLWQLFQFLIPHQREKISWAILAGVLIIARFCNPSSELYIAEHFFEHTALPDLFGIPPEDIYVNRLYRALDHLLPYKAIVEKHIKERFGQLFNIKYDLFLYDVTSTYFEGKAEANSQAKRGYSRDKRSDCKQICIALVVTKEGIPLGYEIFAGNRKDSTTVKQIVRTMEARYGASDRVWVMDRGMNSTQNIAFLKQEKRRYIIGTPKSALKDFEKELLSGQWQAIREDLEVQYCPAPDGEPEVYILCRSASRREKDRAIFQRFAQNIETGLEKIHQSCEKGHFKKVNVAERRIGRLLQRNSRAAKMFNIKVASTDKGRLKLEWSKRNDYSDWQNLTEGCYLLRTNIKDWTAEELWAAYIHLTDAEAAFRIHKSDLELRPVWHQIPDRVHAHVFVCFLAFVLWKCLAQMCKNGGLGNEPRKVLDELKHIELTDVILPTKNGVEIKLQCISKPTPHQRILLQHLKLHIPSRLMKKL
jgi:transposase